MKARVEEILAQIRPALQADGGDVEEAHGGDTVGRE